MTTKEPEVAQADVTPLGQGTGIDPRGPRFGAGITAVLLLIVIALGLSTTTPPALGNPAFLLFAIIVALWGWGAFAGIRKHPFGVIFRRLVRPQIKAPTQLEDPAPPTFAQGVGFAIGLVGLALHLFGVPFGLVSAAIAAFIAAFLNAVFAYCLGCQLYLLGTRVRSKLIARRIA